MVIPGFDPPPAAIAQKGNPRPKSQTGDIPPVDLWNAEESVVLGEVNRKFPAKTRSDEGGRGARSAKLALDGTAPALPRGR